MASGTKLVLTFVTSSGGNTSMTYNYAKQSAGLANIKALMSGIIENGAIFSSVPVASKSAKEVTTSENVYELD